MFQRNGSRHRPCPPQLSHDGSCGVRPPDVLVLALALHRRCLKASKFVLQRRQHVILPKAACGANGPGPCPRRKQSRTVCCGLDRAAQHCAAEVWVGRLACARPGPYGPEARSEVACPGGCDGAEAWQSADEALVAEVHCKAGVEELRLPTSTLLACLLLSPLAAARTLPWRRSDSPEPGAAGEKALTSAPGCRLGAESALR